MKLLLIFLCCASALFAQDKNAGRKVFTDIAVDSLLKVSKTDSIRYVERLAAYYYHQKLNEYRTGKRLKALHWQDAAWLASRNHCMWLIGNQKFDHVQKPGTPFFTGKSPQERLNYVTGVKQYTFSAENILYNSNAFGKRATDIARQIAETSFTQWKNSSDHNTNMLFRDSYAHGTAFVVAEGNLVYAVDVFIYQPEKDVPETFQMPVFSVSPAKR